MQHLPAATHDGRSVDFNIPEYAGETLDDLVRSHRIPEYWRPLIAESDQWLLFVRLEQFGELPELLSRPIKEPEAVLSSAALSPHEEAAVAGASRHPAAASDGDEEVAAAVAGDTELPLDMRLVELLQMLLHERGARPRGGVSKPFLSVLLSCWDELSLTDRSPASAAEERIPLLYSYVRAAWREDAVEFLGLSSQGRSLTTGTPGRRFRRRRSRTSWVCVDRGGRSRPGPDPDCAGAVIGEFGVARFGNVDGSHELQKHSGIPNEVLRAIQWYTDLPSGPREAWQPFHAGFPVSDHYVVRYTRPDPAAERAGMVSTTVIVAGMDIYRHSLRPLLDHSAREPDVAQTCVSAPDSAAPEAPPAGLAGVIDALATNGKAVWLGQAGFSGMVAALWDALAPEDRRRLVFGMVWHPSTIPYPIDDASQMLMVFTAPAGSRQRFDTWPVVNPSEPPAAGRTAAAALRLESDRAVELASRLAIEQPTLVEWTRLVEAADFCAELDDLVDERLRGFTHLLAALAPDKEQGADLKTAVVARISRVTAAAGFAHVRGLRTFPVQAYPSGPDLPELLSRWAVRGIADSGAIDDLTAAVDAARVATVDEWSRTLAIALIDAASHDPVSTKARLTDLANRDQEETFDWLADACTDQGDLDLHLSTWAPSCTTPRVAIRNKSATRVADDSRCLLRYRRSNPCMA